MSNDIIPIALEPGIKSTYIVEIFPTIFSQMRYDHALIYVSPLSDHVLAARKLQELLTARKRQAVVLVNAALSNDVPQDALTGLGLQKYFSDVVSRAGLKNYILISYPKTIRAFSEALKQFENSASLNG